MHDPSRGETFAALRGAGTRLNGRPLGVGPGAPLARRSSAPASATSPPGAPARRRRCSAVLPAVRDVRRFGSAALDLAWVACGRLDGYFERGLNPWDWAAGRLVVSEAGGVVEELEPREEDPVGCVAAPPGLIGPLRALVDEAGA